MLEARAQHDQPQQARRGHPQLRLGARRGVARRAKRLVPRAPPATKRDIQDIKEVLVRLDERFGRQEKALKKLGALTDVLCQMGSLSHVLTATSKLAKDEPWRQPLTITNLSDVAGHFRLTAAEKAYLAKAVLDQDVGFITLLEVVAAKAEDFAQVNQASAHNTKHYKSCVEEIKYLLEDLQNQPQDIKEAWARLSEGVDALRKAAITILHANTNAEGRSTTLQVLTVAVRYCTARVGKTRDALVSLLEKEEGLFVALSCALHFRRLQVEIQLTITGVAARVSGKYHVELAEVKAGAVGDGMTQLWDRLHWSWWILRKAGFMGTMELHGRLLLVAGRLPAKEKTQYDSTAVAEITAHKIVL